MQLARRRDCENGKIFFAPQERHCARDFHPYILTGIMLLFRLRRHPLGVWFGRDDLLSAASSSGAALRHPNPRRFQLWLKTFDCHAAAQNETRALTHTHSTSFPGRALFYPAKTRVFTSHNIKGKRERERDVLKNGVKPSLATALAPFFSTHRFFYALWEHFSFPFII